SLVDAPGHESLMATMLSGAAIVDGALLLVAANEKCPQPQTKEHLMALHISGIKNVIIVQNKIDLVSVEEAMENHGQIKEFLSKTEYRNAPIIPISARANVNIDVLLKAIEESIPTPHRDTDKDPLMLVARSFDVNKPGIRPEKLVGGVLGGTVKQGIFHVGDEIEISPGYTVEEKNKKVAKSLRTKITQIFSGGQPVEEILPGGSMALGTTLDPSIIKSDSLTGSVVGLPGKLPPIHYQVNLETFLLDRVVGTKDETEVKPLAKNEILMLNCNSAATVGVVSDPSKKNTVCVLKKPICATPGDRITISRRVGDRFRLIGYGILK
ncbi:MAG: translation initiation factor IF-2 subunit gamma, partial [Nanoarchaeota archaeon]